VQTGTVVPSPMPTDSGRPHDIYRCSSCGTAVWSVYGGMESLRFMRVGTLDEARALVPTVHIYTRSKHPWVRLPDGVPAFEAYYDSSTVWPPESLARRKALLG